jgi:hypothetical protein
VRKLWKKLKIFAEIIVKVLKAAFGGGWERRGMDGRLEEVGKFDREWEEIRHFQGIQSRSFIKSHQTLNFPSSYPISTSNPPLHPFRSAFFILQKTTQNFRHFSRHSTQSLTRITFAFSNSFSGRKPRQGFNLHSSGRCPLPNDPHKINVE